MNAPPERIRTGGVRSLGLPAQVHACLFDLDGVLTRTAEVHVAAWQEMFDAFLLTFRHHGLPVTVSVGESRICPIPESSTSEPPTQPLRREPQRRAAAGPQGLS